MSVSRASLAVLFVAAAAAVAGLGGCGGAATFLASPDEYAAYRATRVEPELEGRLAAASAYLGRYPEGAFAAEVRAWLRRAEPVYYEAKRGSVAGLTAYLRALPDGAFAREAQDRLAVLQRARAFDEVGRGADIEARLATEQVERRRVRDEIAAWVGRFLDPAAYRGSLSEAPAEVIVPFSLALPRPVCRPLEEEDAAPLAGVLAGPAPPGALRCAKILSLPYAVTGEEGRREPREATVEVAVVEDPAGRPLAATIGGPDLFLRIEEARAVRALAADDAEARVAGIAQAAELAGAAFRAEVRDDPACRREPAPPAVLDLGCAGLRLVVRAAVEPGGDDVIVVAPEPGQAAAQ